jgi:FMN phosphatase YigB (HAD superfamily)
MAIHVAHFQAEIEVISLDYSGTLARDCAPGIPKNRRVSQPLYPKAIGAIAALSSAGLRLILAANTVASEQHRLSLVHVGVFPLVSGFCLSGEIGVSKPDAEFYAYVIEAANAKPERILHVGNTIDEDIIPALAAGMHAVYVTTGNPDRTCPIPEGVPVLDGVGDLPDFLGIPHKGSGLTPDGVPSVAKKG